MCVSSDRLLHNLDVHLTDKSIDTVIIHFGIISSIKKITEKCLRFDVKNVCFKVGLHYHMIEAPLL